MIMFQTFDKNLNSTVTGAKLLYNTHLYSSNDSNIKTVNDIGSLCGLTENAGHENDGHENDGPKLTAGRKVAEAEIGPTV